MGPNQVIADRQTLLDQPPDILLTNYKMLDYLLIRPSDQQLWRRNEPGALRYLVVDELHTFDGAQGTDLACLIRRLRVRLGAGNDLVCVGTSATLGEVGQEERLLDYVSGIFKTGFDADAIVGESRQGIDEFLGEHLITSVLAPHSRPRGGCGPRPVREQRGLPALGAPTLLRNPRLREARASRNGGSRWPTGSAGTAPS